ncbi:hypothetical protein JHV56_14680 [Arthrobacter sp. BHU FT2]|nr:hypothetical protein [Arthrobacter sp. BHU FT2]
MIYTDLAPVVFAAVLAIMIPGLLVSWAAGARGWVLAGSAGPVSVSLISVTAILTGVTGTKWGSVAVLCVSILTAVLLLVARHVVTAVMQKGSSAKGVTSQGDGANEAASRNISSVLIGWIAIVAAFLVLFWRLGEIFGDADNISQTFDNVFHLNAVRYIVETGNASSLLVSGFTSSTGVGGFYPAAWHDVASLTQQLTGATVPAAVNATNVAIAALVWPLSCLLLAAAVLGTRKIVLITASAFAAGFSSFPYLMVDFGVLYPNLLSIALLPAGIGLAALALGAARGLSTSRTSSLILALCSVPGLALAHPSTLMALLVWTYPALIVGAVALFRHWIPLVGKLRAAGAVVLGLALYTAVLVIAWTLVRPDEAQAAWQPVQGLAQAFGQALTSAPQGRPIPWLIFAMTLLGIWAVLRHGRHFWLLVMFGISCVMFIVVSGYPAGPLRTFVGGIWYNDPPRLAALLPVAALPMAVAGAVWLTDAGVALMRPLVAGIETSASTQVKRGGAVVPVAVTVIAMTVVLGLTQGGTIRASVESAAASYALSPNSWLVDSNEMALLERVAAEVPADNLVVSSPWTGASMVYAIAGRRSLTPHIFSEYGDDTRTILHSLNEAGENPAVCRSVRNLKANYVLDFGTREVHGGLHPFPGLQNLEADNDFELVDSEGPARLYKIRACDNAGN